MRSYAWYAAMVGDAGVGKTSLMVRFVTGSFSEDYIETLGVSFLSKRVKLPQAEVTMSIWDLAGAREHQAMLPTACAEAVVVLYMFDLNDPRSLRSVRDWYKQVRLHNATARAVLVGCKFDSFFEQDKDYQADTTKRARRYAAVMSAPLIFCSSLHSINVKKLFRLVFNMAFDIPPSIRQLKEIGTPIFEYDHVMAPREGAGDDAGEEEVPSKPRRSAGPVVATATSAEAPSSAVKE
jgi:Gtp-binding protein of the ras superfamily involved in termination of M-phase